MLAAAAPILVAGIFLATGLLPPAVLAYHLFCLALVLRHRDRVRPWLRWEPSLVPWLLGTTAVVSGFLLCAPLVQDPRAYQEVFHRVLFPRGASPLVFWGFVAYSLIVHSPLEEIFWRAVVTDPGHPRRGALVAGNALGFGLLHAIPMGMILGGPGVLMALPTAAAGAIWAWVTIRSRSLWPALVSHWGADALILAGMWFFFIR
jgi:membrane protease YdiL (CAAX protease family)